MSPYDGLKAYFGDLHNHCGISYGHGPIEDALANARERLDFCSVTGHAHWPDMPAPSERIQYIIDFHKEGFARLKGEWQRTKGLMKAVSADGRFLAFPGFEIHSCEFGDYTIVYKQCEGDIIYADSLPALIDSLRALRATGVEALAFPHHLAYRRGTRGVNWDAFTNEFSPVVEIISMHGCSETNETPRPFLHTMGPADWESTMAYGLEQGHVFGVIGGTDHHSGHPGSYGHGLMGAWAEALTRDALWDAILARRTYALTGDRIDLKFAINGAPMGAVIPRSDSCAIDIAVLAGGAIDYVDIVKNNRLLKRFSECDCPGARNAYSNAPRDMLRTKLLLELGWGARSRETSWDVTFGVSAGRIVACEPRFRGREVVSPIDKQDDSSSYYQSRWERDGERAVHFTTVTTGNPNNFTSATQGFCFDVELPPTATVQTVLNGVREETLLSRLIAGARTGRLGDIDSPAWRLHRAPLQHEFEWRVSFHDLPAGDGDCYYARLRQKNDQWAWSSPIFIRG